MSRFRFFPVGDYHSIEEVISIYRMTHDFLFKSDDYSQTETLANVSYCRVSGSSSSSSRDQCSGEFSKQESTVHSPPSHFLLATELLRNFSF